MYALNINIGISISKWGQHIGKINKIKDLIYRERPISDHWITGINWRSAFTYKIQLFIKLYFKKKTKKQEDISVQETIRFSGMGKI